MALDIQRHRALNTHIVSCMFSWLPNWLVCLPLTGMDERTNQASWAPGGESSPTYESSRVRRPTWPTWPSAAEWPFSSTVHHQLCCVICNQKGLANIISGGIDCFTSFLFLKLWIALFNSKCSGNTDTTVVECNIVQFCCFVSNGGL